MFFSVGCVICARRDPEQRNGVASGPGYVPADCKAFRGWRSYRSRDFLYDKGSTGEGGWSRSILASQPAGSREDWNRGTL